MVASTDKGQHSRRKAMNLSDTLNEYLHKQGAELVGFADLSSISSGVFNKGIAIAVPLSASVASKLDRGLTHEYFEAYHRLEAELNKVALSGEAFLKEHGYKAFAQTSQRVREDANWCTKVPHKTVATNAGWAGSEKAAFW